MQRILLAVAVAVPLLSGCEGMRARQQDRCQTANWTEVGERDGFEIGRESMQMQAERYKRICGDMFQAEPYSQGVQKGAGRRPRPPV